MDFPTTSGNQDQSVKQSSQGQFRNRIKNKRSIKQTAIASTPLGKNINIPDEIDFVEKDTLTLKTPLPFATVTLYALGSVDSVKNRNISNFHKKSYIYPVGYKVKREYYGLTNLSKKEDYFALVENNAGKPRYVITLLNGKRIAAANSPSRVWMDLIELINKKRKREGFPLTGSRTSGQQQYGFTIVQIAELIFKYCDMKNRCTAYVGLSSARRNSSGKRLVTFSNPRPEKPKLPEFPKYNVHQVIEARFEKNQYWYPAYVEKVFGRDKYRVVYDDGEAEDNVHAKYIRKRKYIEPPILLQLALPSSLFEVGRAVEANWKMGPYWYKGKVKAIYEKDMKVCYDIDYDDGDTEYGLRAKLVRRPTVQKQQKKSKISVKHKAKTKKESSKQVVKKEVFVADPVSFGTTVLLSTLLRFCAEALDLNKQKVIILLNSKPVLTGSSKYSQDKNVLNVTIEKLKAVFPKWTVQLSEDSLNLEINFSV